LHFNQKRGEMKRMIVKIDEERCVGCGSCVAGCHGGALQLIDGKARIIDENYCDGLGICIGECPVGAISLEERESKPYDKQAVVEKPCACPSSTEQSFEQPTVQNEENLNNFSQLCQWPVQLHLLNPEAAFLRNADLVLAADCTAFAFGNFHNQFLKNKCLAIACPKLDHANDIYVEKLTAMFDCSAVNSLTVIIMEVPCCRGLLQIAQQAQAAANRKIPIRKRVIGIKGELQSE
jgi:ferredoxin